MLNSLKQVEGGFLVFHTHLQVALPHVHNTLGSHHEWSTQNQGDLNIFFNVHDYKVHRKSELVDFDQDVFCHSDWSCDGAVYQL